VKTLAFFLPALCCAILLSSLPHALGAEPPKNAVLFGNATLDEVTLIGLSKEEALKRLGDPEQILGPEEGFQTYEYAARHQLSVVFNAGKLVQYLLRPDSKAKTAKSVQLGSHLGAVTKAYSQVSSIDDTLSVKK
jgi:hypothetical protein